MKAWIGLFYNGSDYVFDDGRKYWENSQLKSKVGTPDYQACYGVEKSGISRHYCSDHLSFLCEYRSNFLFLNKKYFCKYL